MHCSDILILTEQTFPGGAACHLHLRSLNRSGISPVSFVVAFLGHKLKCIAGLHSLAVVWLSGCRDLGCHKMLKNKKYYRSILLHVKGKTLKVKR